MFWGSSTRASRGCMSERCVAKTLPTLAGVLSSSTNMNALCRSHVQHTRSSYTTCVCLHEPCTRLFGKLHVRSDANSHEAVRFPGASASACTSPQTVSRSVSCTLSRLASSRQLNRWSNRQCLQKRGADVVMVSESYTRGQVCDLTGHDRTVLVHYTCEHAGLAFMSIQELTSCQYVALLGTPEVCSLTGAKEVPPQPCQLPSALTTCRLYSSIYAIIHRYVKSGHLPIHQPYGRALKWGGGFRLMQTSWQAVQQ